MKTSIFAVILALSMAQLAQAAGTCPRAIVLKSPRFINRQLFPSNQQILSNFNQTFFPPGEPHTPIWSNGDLQVAVDVVKSFESEYRNDEIVLMPHLSRGVCGGRLASIPYTVDSSGIEISSGEFDQDFVSIGIQQHAGVRFSIAFPSNCSGCSGRIAELFEFLSVTRIDN